MHALTIATTQVGDKTSILLSTQNQEFNWWKNFIYEHLLLPPQSNTQNH